MRLGVVLPTFSMTPDVALTAAAEVARAGLDGAFVYDHLWPMGNPGKPAIAAYPLLGALAGLGGQLVLGTLVARVDLVETEALVRQLATVSSLNGGRFIAGIGTGDIKGAAEYEAYGLLLRPATERRALLEQAARLLIAAGISVWVGAGSAETNAIAQRLELTLNLWNASPGEVARIAELGPVSWGGNLPRDPHEASDLVGGLEAAGASWAVFAWPGSTDPILAAASKPGVAEHTPDGRAVETNWPL
jgi:alkanesulfonate monooxygenase SsuD/methylene tetrahydromethanopterin reductase-like flavin-dependent oxidoreductase (luciferase family)